MIGQDPYHGPGQAHGTRNWAPLILASDAIGYMIFFLLTHRLSQPCCPLPDRSLLLGATRCPYATLAEECKPPLSLPILHPPPPPHPTYAIPLSYDSCHSFRGGRGLDLCGNQGRISRLRPPKARVRKFPDASSTDPPLLFPFFSLFFCILPTARVAHVLMLSSLFPFLPHFSHLSGRNLTAWAEAGVLMLNTCLTVRAHTAGSHQGKGWEQFTDRVIEVVDRYGGANLGEKSGFGRGVVFLAWGAWAAKRVAKLSKVSRSFQRQPHGG